MRHHFKLPNSRWITCLLLGLTCLSTNSLAVTWGVGTTTSSGQPGISVQRTHLNSGWHLTSHMLTGKNTAMSLDYQRFTTPPFGYFRKSKAVLKFYSGAGLKAQMTESESQQEEFLLRIPLGAQLNFIEYHGQLFADFAAQLGPLPKTFFEPAAQLGLRASF